MYNTGRFGSAKTFREAVMTETDCTGLRVGLANPPTFENPGKFFRPVRFPTFNYATPVMHPPLFLLLAASYLRDVAHCEVQFIDAQAPGLTVDEYVDAAIKFKPDLLVFETCLPSFANDIDVARLVKKRCDCKVVFCGAQVGAVPEEMLQRGGGVLDAVVMGEYELTLQELAACRCARPVPGSAIIIEGEIKKGPPRTALEELDLIPPPDRSLLHNKCYYDPLLKNPFAYFLAGRGCVHRCTFCSWPQTFTGNRYRTRKPELVAEEVRSSLAADPSVRSFLFNDDTFTSKRENVIAICRELKKAGVKIPWGCYARADLADEEMLRAMRDAGCYLLKIGVESADEKILRECRKGYQLDKVENAVALMKRLAYHVHATFTFGLPGETQASIDHTVAWAKKLAPTTVQFSVAVPYPGTVFYDYLREHGCLRSTEWADFVPLRPLYDYPEISGEELIHQMKRAYASYYLRPQYFPMALRRFIDEPALFPAVLRKFFSLIWQR